MKINPRVQMNDRFPLVCKMCGKVDTLEHWDRYTFEVLCNTRDLRRHYTSLKDMRNYCTNYYYYICPNCNEISYITDFRAPRGDGYFDKVSHLVYAGKIGDKDIREVSVEDFKDLDFEDYDINERIEQGKQEFNREQAEDALKNRAKDADEKE